MPGGALAGFSLDAPAPGAADTYALDLRGWVVGTASPVDSVLVLRDGVLLRPLPVEIERPDVAAAHPGLPGAERSGFFGTLSALSFGPRFELQIEVRLEDGTQLPLALVRGTRAPLRSSFEPRLQPLLLTTLGRTGSTAVVRMLAAHPEVVAYRPFEYEPRVATYWMGVLPDAFRPGELSPPAGADGNDRRRVVAGRADAAPAADPRRGARPVARRHRDRRARGCRAAAHRAPVRGGRGGRRSGRTPATSWRSTAPTRCPS